MIAILTGDIVQSRKKKVTSWLPVLKDSLALYGPASGTWEIFRGDSFQLRVAPDQALKAALHLKAAIKEIKELDVRIGIGLGTEDYRADKISESNGEAYVRSGHCFENLRKQHLGMISGDPEIDETFNLLFSLAMITADNWSPVVAASIRLLLLHPEKNQTELAAIMEKSQSSLSEALKRGATDELLRLDAFYQKKISRL